MLIHELSHLVDEHCGRCRMNSICLGSRTRSTPVLRDSGSRVKGNPPCDVFLHNILLKGFAVIGLFPTRPSDGDGDHHDLFTILVCDGLQGWQITRTSRTPNGKEFNQHRVSLPIKEPEDLGWIPRICQDKIWGYIVKR